MAFALLWVKPALPGLVSPETFSPDAKLLPSSPMEPSLLRVRLMTCPDARRKLAPSRRAEPKAFDALRSPPPPAPAPTPDSSAKVDGSEDGLPGAPGQDSLCLSVEELRLSNDSPVTCAISVLNA